MTQQDPTTAINLAEQAVQDLRDGNLINAWNALQRAQAQVAGMLRFEDRQNAIDHNERREYEQEIEEMDERSAAREAAKEDD